MSEIGQKENRKIQFDTVAWNVGMIKMYSKRIQLCKTAVES